MGKARGSVRSEWKRHREGPSWAPNTYYLLETRDDTYRIEVVGVGQYQAWRHTDDGGKLLGTVPSFARAKSLVAADRKRG